MIRKNVDTTSTSGIGLVVPFVDLGRQIRTLSDLPNALLQVCERGDFILGGEVKKFEEAFAQYVGVSDAISVASGLDALRLSLAALEIGPGDEVILPANTFIATALAVSAAGAKTILVDCDPRTMNIDVAKIPAAITNRTRAIMPVHLTGRAAEMQPIMDLASARGLAVIEDACQAHGATYRGRPCGAMGNTGCFSFYPGKNLGAFGDGGIITTNDANLAKRLRRMRNYGQEVKHHHLEKGWNSRLDTMQAAVLNIKLSHLDNWNTARAQHANDYRKLLKGVGDFELPAPSDADSKHVYHLFMIETFDRDGLQKFLSSRGVQTGIHYPIPVHLQPAYADLGYREGDFPVAERLANHILSLPMFPELTHNEIAYVVEALDEWHSEGQQSEGAPAQPR